GRPGQRFSSRWAARCTSGRRGAAGAPDNSPSCKGARAAPGRGGGVASPPRPTRRGLCRRSTMFSLGKPSSVFTILVSTAALCAPVRGQAKDPPPPAAEEPLKGDALRVVSVKPASPPALKRGEKMEVAFLSSSESAERVLIFVRPYTKGQKTPALGTASPSPFYKKGKGKGAGFFQFLQPASVDELRIEMQDAKTRQPIVVLKHPVKAEWK